jgi:CheY-like chemotaxis protein
VTYDGSISRVHGGLGLGLAIVRHIVELHGGSVAADSPGKDQGATFTIRLPLMVTHAKGSYQGKAHPGGGYEEALHFQASRILEGVKVIIVDDEPESLLLLSTVLIQSGAYVKTAASAEEGLTQIKGWRPDVIVSDIGMPGEDGYSFMKRVKTWAREAGVWIPAVALTAYARAEDRMKALASGYQIHVPKPVEPAELITVLVSLVERSKGPGTTTS